MSENVWPPIVRDRGTRRSLRQGDLVKLPSLAYLVSPRHPVDEDEARETAGLPDKVVAMTVDIPTGTFVIVSNTCDVWRDYTHDDDRFVILAPLQYISNDDTYKLARDGVGSTLFFNFPDLDGRKVWLDNRTLVTITKPALLQQEVGLVASPLSAPQLTALQRWLAARFGRAGWPDEFDRHVIRPIRKGLTAMLTRDETILQIQPALIFIGVAHTEGTGRVSLLLLADMGRVKANEGMLDAAGRKVQRDIRKRISEAGGAYTVDVTARDATQVSAAHLLGHRQLLLDG